jgi:hypothetical protein
MGECVPAGAIYPGPYSAECVEGKFSEVGLPLYGVLTAGCVRIDRHAKL